MTPERSKAFRGTDVLSFIPVPQVFKLPHVLSQMSSKAGYSRWKAYALSKQVSLSLFAFATTTYGLCTASRMRVTGVAPEQARCFFLV